MERQPGRVDWLLQRRKFLSGISFHTLPASGNYFHFRHIPRNRIVDTDVILCQSGSELHTPDTVPLTLATGRHLASQKQLLLIFHRCRHALSRSQSEELLSVDRVRGEQLARDRCSVARVRFEHAACHFHGKNPNTTTLTPLTENKIMKTKRPL